MRIRSFALAAAFFLAATALSFAQYGSWGNRGTYGQSNQKQAGDAYNNGYKDGVWDRQHNNPFQYRPHRIADQMNQRAYEQGYSAGYGQNGRYAQNGGVWNRGGGYGDGDGDADDRGGQRHHRNGGWGNNGNGNGGYGNGPYNNGPYNNSGVWGNRGGYGQNGNQAYSYGYQDGVMDGRNDRATGHSYRPTQGDRYKHANTGWNGQMSRDQFVQQYRQGYTQGYQQGYNGAGRRY
jgi:hypothetical protein